MCDLTTAVVCPKPCRRFNNVRPIASPPWQCRLTWNTRACGAFRLSDCLSDNGDAFNVQNNPDVRELVDRMQKYHDDVEKEFTGQKV